MALTPEQIKTIRVARAAYKNMWNERLGPALKEFADWQRQQFELAPPALRATFQRREQPQENPEEQARMRALLEEVSQKKNGGK